ncbi:GIY-YIG nuclease family protein [Brevundimonas sp.]|uniref:GIY-YIG nuclease family protein n=1 Tax=Brevundimonas sp. TaxID=1871086 RepID=UPI00286AC493|nr:GIY-YIG nuclease family protein [Brevundimonas sp.]
MPHHQSRRALLAAYKDRKTVAGVFAVVCTATGEVWVGRSSHIENHRNGLWFALRHSGYPRPDLQSAWNTHGEENFRFEGLDHLSPDLSRLERDGELKRRAALWSAGLQAYAL